MIKRRTLLQAGAMAPLMGAAGVRDAAAANGPGLRKRVTVQLPPRWTTLYGGDSGALLLG